MRLTTLALTAIALGAGKAPAAAQAQGASTAAVQAAIVTGLSVTRIADLSFGSVAQGSGIRSVAATSAAAGEFQISGGDDQFVIVTLTAPKALTRAGSSIPYSPAASYNQTTDDPAAPTGTFNFGGTNAVRLLRLRDLSAGGGVGMAHIYVYGSIDVGVVPPGTYAGTFTLSAVY